MTDFYKHVVETATEEEEAARTNHLMEATEKLKTAGVGRDAPLGDYDLAAMNADAHEVLAAPVLALLGPVVDELPDPHVLVAGRQARGDRRTTPPHVR